VDQAQRKGASDANVVVPQWVQLVVLPLVILFIWIFAGAASHAVLLFVIAGLISIVLNPLVRGMTERRVPRPIAVTVVFLGFSIVVAVTTIIAVNIAVHQTERARDNLPHYVSQAQIRIDKFQTRLDNRNINYNLREEGQRFLDRFEESGLKASRRALTFSRDFIGTVASTLFNIILVVVITVYMLLDAPRIGRFVTGLFPRHGKMETLFPRIEHQLFNYVRGQLAVSFVIGATAAVGLWTIGAVGIWPDAKGLAVPFGIIAAITEVAPSIGPVLGSIPPIAVAAFYDPWAAVIIAIFYTLLHQIEGHIVVPRLMGSAVGVHPLVIIFGIVAGAQILGVGGIILVLPLLAVGSEIVRWLRERLELQEWTGHEIAPVAQAAAAATLTSHAAAVPLERPSASSEERADGAFVNRLRDLRQRMRRNDD
jgi:predicted PurR-regulated permease PerM